MGRKIILGGLVSLAALGTLTFISKSSAEETRPAFGPNYTEERHAKMLEAFEKKDYDAWKELMGDRGATRKVNKENFEKFAQMHTLRLEGKTAQADEIRKELGLGAGYGRGHGQGQGRKNSCIRQ